MEVVTSGGRTKKKLKVCVDQSMTDIGSMIDSKTFGQQQQGKGGRGGGCMEHEPKQNQVGSVMLFGVPIVSLVMDGKERLCLAQISSTLLKEFSYNEIHNRRVALGITCIQCTPVQLEILRRAGAMPVTSRRCGMITKREAERLCQSFLGDHAPPQLPENFAFEVYHECAWGCRGAFVPSRYNSSRAKCIRCTFCQLFFSPNKFIFHSHRLPDSRYVQPDAANFNSWRRHLKLCGDPPEEVETSSSPGLMTAQIVHAWEDVKAMFNGGTRKRLLAAGSMPSPPPNNSSSANKSLGSSSKHSCSPSLSSASEPLMSKCDLRNSREKYSPPFSSTFTTSNNNNHLSRSAPVVQPVTYAPGGSLSFNPSSTQQPNNSYLSPGGLGQEIQSNPQQALTALPTPVIPGGPQNHRMVDIWNPGFSAAAAAAAAAAVAASAGTSIAQQQQPSRTNGSPFPFHPLALPWLRRPSIFPFTTTSTHPFGPTCSKLFESAEALQPPPPPPSSAISASSAFKPVGGLRNAAEQWFSWLNNNNGLVVGGPPAINCSTSSSSMYPEDLSAAAAAGATATGIGIGDFGNPKLYPFDMSVMMVESGLKRKSFKRPVTPADSASGAEDDEDEETVDIESTTEVGEPDSSSGCGGRGGAWMRNKKVGSQNYQIARYEKNKTKRRLQDIHQKIKVVNKRMKCPTTKSSTLNPCFKSFRKHGQESSCSASSEEVTKEDENVDDSLSCSDRDTPDVLSLTD